MSLNMPFEPVGGDPFPLPDPDPLLSGGVVVGSLLLTLAGGRHPGILFRFAKADGTGFHPPVVLTCDRPGDLEALPDLVRQAVDCAITGARS